MKVEKYVKFDMTVKQEKDFLIWDYDNKAVTGHVFAFLLHFLWWQSIGPITQRQTHTPDLFTFYK